jgi:hypothetical protein
VSFILTGCPTDSDDGGGGDNTTPSVTIKDVSTESAINVAAGDNKLVVTATGGSLKSGLKVYLKDGGTEITISTGAAPEGFAEVASGDQVSVTGGVITVTGLEPAAANATVKVTLAADAQGEQVTSITAVSLKVVAVSTVPAISVTAGDDTLAVTVTGGSLVAAGDLKVYVKNATFDEAVITKAESLTDYTVVGGARASVAGGVITVSGLKPATVGGAAGVLKAGLVKVTLAADAQVTPVTSITAESRNSGDQAVTGTELTGADIAPYSVTPTGAVVAPAVLVIGDTTVIASGTVAAAAYTDVNGSKSFDGGDTQVFTITLTAASGHTFANTGIAPAAVAAAALDGTVFTAAAIGDSAAIATTSVTTLVVTVTYTKPGDPDDVITSAGLTAAIITPYNTAPTGAAVGEDITLEGSTVISAVNVAAAAYSGSATWGAGATQEFTITLTAAAGYTFVGPDSLTAAQIVAAVLGDSFTRHISNVTGTPDNPYEVTVTYTKPGVIGTTELANITAYNTRPDGVAFEVPVDLTIATNSAIASGNVAAAAYSGSAWGPNATQDFTITLEPKNGYTFVGASDADIVAAVLGSYFTGKTSVTASGAAADPYVATVTYTRPADTTINSTLLASAGIAKYDAAPDGTAVAETLPITDPTAIKSVTVSAPTVSGTWGVGSTQVFTITLDRNDWYTFTGTGKLTAEQIAKAVLGPDFVGTHVAYSGTATNPFVVKVTYREPARGSLTVNAGVDYRNILDTTAPVYAPVAKTVTATISSNGHTIGKWYIDGEEVPTESVTLSVGSGNTYVLSIPTGLSAKTHSLTVTATKGDGIPYSQTVTFTVTE